MKLGMVTYLMGKDMGHQLTDLELVRMPIIELTAKLLNQDVDLNSRMTAEHYEMPRRESG